MYIYIHYVSGFKIFKTHPSRWGKSQARLPSTACRGRVYGSAPRQEPMSSGGSLVEKSPKDRHEIDPNMLGVGI